MHDAYVLMSLFFLLTSGVGLFFGTPYVTFVAFGFSFFSGWLAYVFR